jgi:hypothetical protein
MTYKIGLFSDCFRTTFQFADGPFLCRLLIRNRRSESIRPIHEGPVRFCWRMRWTKQPAADEWSPWHLAKMVQKWVRAEWRMRSAECGEAGEQEQVHEQEGMEGCHRSRTRDDDEHEDEAPRLAKMVQKWVLYLDAWLRRLGSAEIGWSFRQVACSSEQGDWRTKVYKSNSFLPFYFFRSCTLPGLLSGLGVNEIVHFLCSLCAHFELEGFRCAKARRATDRGRRRSAEVGKNGAKMGTAPTSNAECEVR